MIERLARYIGCVADHKLILITLLGMVLYGMVLGLERLLVVRDARIQ